MQEILYIVEILYMVINYPSYEKNKQRSRVVKWQGSCSLLGSLFAAAVSISCFVSNEIIIYHNFVIRGAAIGAI